MSQIFADNKVAVTEEYNKYHGKLQSYLYRLTCDKAVAEDLAQDAFVKAIENLHSFQHTSSFKTWLFSIATNLAIDWSRKFSRWKENAQDEAKRLAESDIKYPPLYQEISSNSPQGKYEIKEHIDFCFTCISKTLPVEQQVVLILKDIYDFQVSEVGQIIQKPSGTVKDWLFQARKTMTEIYDRRCALINKTGICHQCSQLNGFFNPRQKTQEDFLLAKTQKDKYQLLEIRTKLVKAIDPLNSEGAAIQDAIMQTLRTAIKEK